MGVVKGKREYNRFKQGEKLTRKQAIIAQCYVCNGLDEGAEDCQGSKSCPMYQYFYYRAKSEAPE